MAKKFKGFTGIKTMNGEVLKFKNGVTIINGDKYTLDQVKQLLKEIDELDDSDYPKAEGW